MINFQKQVQLVQLQTDSAFVQPESACKKMLRSVKGIIFDFDGTLFDNALIAFRLIKAYPLDWRRIWKERLIRKRFSGCDYSSPEEYYNAFFSELGKACFRSPKRMRDWYFDHYIPRMISVLRKYYEARPGAAEFFSRMKNNSTRIAVYSDYPLLKERMATLGLYTSDNILLYGPESFGAQKPAVRPLLKIAEDIGIPPEEILVIGDREETDGLGAFNAGMRFFCLETGRKRNFRLDPYRRREKEEPHGPTLLMYAGRWEALIKLL